MYVEDNKIRKYVKQLPVYSNMRFRVFLYLFAFCVTIYSQDRICFIDSLDFCKDEIEKLERYNLKKIKRKYPAYRKYSNLKQLHFFMLKNKTNCPITKEEYLDYSFLRKMCFFRTRRHLHRFKRDIFLDAATFVFTPEGKLVGKIRSGFVEPPNWMEIYNAGDLGRLVAENKISFAFCGGIRSRLYTRESWENGGDMDCVVIEGKIFLLNNLDRSSLDDSANTKFQLIPLEDFINK